LPRGPGPQTIFRGETAPRTGRLRATRSRLRDVRAGAIAIHARRRNIDKPPRYNPRPRQRRNQTARARIVASVGRRRSEVQHGERGEAQSVERSEPIEVAQNRHDAVAAELRDLLRATRQSEHACAAAQQFGRAQRDITATDH